MEQMIINLDKIKDGVVVGCISNQRQRRRRLVRVSYKYGRVHHVLLVVAQGNTGVKEDKWIKKQRKEDEVIIDGPTTL